jgi:hypothetical protein
LGHPVSEIFDDLTSRILSTTRFGTPISVIDIFDLINPKGTLKDANSSAHDIGYNDIWLAILLMKEDDLAVGERWEKLAALVTGNEVVPAWESKKQDIKSSVQEKRDQ